MDIQTFRVYRATIPLSFLQILDLYTVSFKFYESLNEKNRMCELCTSSQIRSHTLTEGTNSLVNELIGVGKMVQCMTNAIKIAMADTQEWWLVY